MAVSSGLGRPLLSESQAQKATAANLAMQAMEDAISAKLTIDTSAATTLDDVVDIPFDDTNDLSPREALRCIYMDLSAGATAEFFVNHPTSDHLFYIKNNTTQTAKVIVNNLTGSFVTVLTGQAKIILVNGTTITSLDTSTPQTLPYDFSASIYGTLVGGDVVARFLVGRNVVFDNDLQDSVGDVIVNPTAAATVDVEVDGTKVGEINVTTGGVVSFTDEVTAIGSVSAGSIIELVNQATADASMAGLTVVLVARVA